MIQETLLLKELLGNNEMIYRTVIGLGYMLIYPGLIMIVIAAALLLWAERKIVALVQLRYGPLWISRRIGGALQGFADLIRFSFQEVIIPRRSDVIPFLLSPGLAILFSVLPIAFMPVSPYIKPPIHSDIGLLAAIAVISVAPIFIVLMGWASDNKFAFVGSLREALLIVSYEIPFIISILSMGVMYSSLDFYEIVERQSLLPGMLLNPFAFLASFIAMLRVTSRFPFEISEAETEIVAGPYTEYSGLMFGLSMGLAYIKLYVYALMVSLVFLGGWLPIVSGEGVISGFLIPSLIVIIKLTVVCLVAVFLRAVYGRYRIDQAIRIGWIHVFALSIVSLVWSIILVYGGWIRWV
ncbi:MAG: NADH-quinone oxidoreductase subunit NuoH [Sulfolobales archaeon]